MWGYYSLTDAMQIADTVFKKCVDWTAPPLTDIYIEPCT